MELATLSSPARSSRRGSPIEPSFTFRTGVIVIVTLTFIWRYWTMSQWSWFQDDWVYLTQSVEMPFWEYILQNYNGHIMPAQFAIVWAITQVAPLNYSFAVATGLVAIVVALAAWILALRELFGERTRLLFPIALFAMSPLLMPITLWWAAAMQIFPLLATQGLVVLFVARYLHRGRRLRDLASMLAAFALGLLFWEKALLVAIPAAFIAVLLLEGTVVQRCRQALVVLVPLSLVSVAYLIGYLLLTREGDAASTELFEPRTLTDSLTFFATGVLDVGVPMLLGGPWSTVENPQQVFATSSGVLTMLLITLLVVGAVVTLRWRRDGRLVLAMVATYALVSWGLLFTSSRFDVLGIFLVRDARYAADIMPAALLALAFIITPLRQSSQPWLLRPLPAAWPRIRSGLGAVAVAASASALVFSGLNWDSAAPNSPKGWVDGIVADAVAARDVSVYNTLAPSNVIYSAYFVGDGRLSQLLKPLETQIRWNAPAETIYVADWAGHFKEAVIGPASTNASPGPVEGCGFAVSAGESILIPLQPELYNWEWGYQLDYFTGGDAILAVHTDNEVVDLVLDRGLHRRQFVITDSARAIRIDAGAGSSTVCVTGLRAGPIEPSDRWIGDMRTEAAK